MLAKRLWWGVAGAVGAVAILAVASLPWVSYQVNMTHSLPGHIYIVLKGSKPEKGDLVAYKWRGGATYPPGATFIKVVAGVEGDAIEVRERSVYVGGTFIGNAKTHSKAGIPLEPVKSGVLEMGELFVATPHPDSLDSRYKLGGPVQPIQVLGRAYVLF